MLVTLHFFLELLQNIKTLLLLKTRPANAFGANKTFADSILFLPFPPSGCYPNCPPDKPYFHEDQMKCVSLCDCYDDEDGKIYKRDECNIW